MCPLQGRESAKGSRPACSGRKWLDSPQIQPIIMLSGGAMKYPFVLLAASCLLSAASAQWLETTIPLPDSLSGMTSPRQLIYGSASNTMYVIGAAGLVIAMDGASGQKIARIPTG